MAKLFANSEDPDQMTHSAASNLGLHSLPITLLRVSRLQWVNVINTIKQMNPDGKVIISSVLLRKNNKILNKCLTEK